MSTFMETKQNTVWIEKKKEFIIYKRMNEAHIETKVLQV